MKSTSYWEDIWKKYWGQKSGIFGSLILAIFIFIALYAPFLASSKPIAIKYDNEWYFPLFRYLFSSFFYSKSIDLFFNILGACFPLLLLLFWLPKKMRAVFYTLFSVLVTGLFITFGFFITLDPANDSNLTLLRQNDLLQKETLLQETLLSPTRERYPFPSFSFELQYLNNYAKLNRTLDAYMIQIQDTHIRKAISSSSFTREPYTLYFVHQEHVESQITRLQEVIKKGLSDYKKSRDEEHLLANKLYKNPNETLQSKLKELVTKNRDFEELQNRLQYIKDKENWLAAQQKKITFILMPLVRPFHWQDDAGGDQALNLKLPFIDLSRINRQDLMSALIFGVRISLFVGLAATAISLFIGIPLGLISGYYGAKVDIVLCRLVEVWESMPAFFMLLLIVTLLETKSIFLIITVIALFSWTTSFRFVRAETLRQRQMLYVDACHALGYTDARILFCHLLPNSIVPIIALLPFDMMSSITREAGLAFLGLGEEQSASWGQLMDEGRAAFPAESALLWPPAIALTILLIGIAFVGDALHNAMDPKGS